MTPCRLIMGLTLVSVALTSGCQHCCKKRSAQPGPGTFGPPGPTGGPPTLPPQNIPPFDAPPRTGMRPEILLPTPKAPAAPVAPGTSQYAPVRPRVILGDPDFSPPAAAIDEKKPIAKAPAPLPKVEDDSISAMPGGIASFAQVKENVSGGLRPQLDGLDWLRSKNYKSVLFLRDSKDDDSSDRRQIEQRGMTYQSLIVTPETLTPSLVKEFIRVVNAPSGRPIFVYDLDGKRAGVMWYLYFRYADLLSDDVAQVRAGRFGFKEKGDAEQTQLWTAVQKYLADNKP